MAINVFTVRYFIPGQGEHWVKSTGTDLLSARQTMAEVLRGIRKGGAKVRRTYEGIRLPLSKKRCWQQFSVLSPHKGLPGRMLWLDRQVVES